MSHQHRSVLPLTSVYFKNFTESLLKVEVNYISLCSFTTAVYEGKFNDKQIEKPCKKPNIVIENAVSLLDRQSKKVRQEVSQKDSDRQTERKTSSLRPQPVCIKEGGGRFPGNASLDLRDDQLL